MTNTSKITASVAVVGTAVAVVRIVRSHNSSSLKAVSRRHALRRFASNCTVDVVFPDETYNF